MGLRSWLKRVEHSARGTLASFELEDGSRFYFDPEQGEVFLHTCECLRAQGEGATAFPEPPPVVQAIARAKDRRAAFERVYSGDFSVLPYDRDALIERGELVPVSMVVGVALGEVLPDLSE
jgi:hypothetical protein